MSAKVRDLSVLAVIICVLGLTACTRIPASDKQSEALNNATDFTDSTD
ncbi:MAG: hypothetical protein ABSC60_08895 [Acidobacteriota bacterium]|jgi:hypothetical protein